MHSSFVDLATDSAVAASGGADRTTVAASGSLSQRRWSATGARSIVVTSALAAVAIAGVAVFGPLLGMRLPFATLLILAFGAVAMELLPRVPLQAVTVVGLAALVSTNKVYALYHVALVVGLYCARKRTAVLAAVLVGSAIVLPKYLFQSHYHQPGFYNWINEPSLALALFVTGRWWREARDGRLVPAARQASLLEFGALFFFPGHAANPIVYGAGDLFRERRTDIAGVLQALLLLASKALAHVAIVSLFPEARYAALDTARVTALSSPVLWGVVLLNYVDLALTLSGTADLAVMIARLYGWAMPSPFRWALLAWNPVELWRRWGFYNRRFLLGFVYHPLGGGRRHRYRNVMLTFLASAWVMHSGWFGSKYWQVGVPGWRDEGIYFLLQGTAVCLWMFCSERKRWKSDSQQSSDRAIRWSWARLGGTVATQATSALIHVVILAQTLPLAERFRLIGRCLGLG